MRLPDPRSDHGPGRHQPLMGVVSIVIDGIGVYEREAIMSLVGMFGEMVVDDMPEHP